MTIQERVKAAIDTTGIPAYLNAWRATRDEQEIPEKYATYSLMYGENPLGADNRDRLRCEYVRVDLYGPGDLYADFEAIKAALRAAGFGIRRWADISDVEPTGYHCNLTATYIMEED